jgi:oligosaccharide repeat unit polymerase
MIAGVGRDRAITFPKERLVMFGNFTAACCGAMAVVINLHATGVSFGSLLNVSAILDTTNSLSKMRYEQAYVAPLAARILFVPTYAMSVVNGFLLTSEQWPRKGLVVRLCVVIFAPVLLGSLLFTTRATVLYWLLFTLSGAVLGLTAGHTGEVPLFTKRRVILMSIGGIAVPMLFIVGQLLRAGTNDLGRLSEVLFHLRIWFFGTICGFSWWIDHEAGFGLLQHLRWGEVTFRGIFAMFGAVDSAEVQYEQMEIGSGQYSNLFSAFRGLIEDFGLPGTALFLIVFGILAGAGCGLVRRGNLRGGLWYAAGFIFWLWSPIYSITAYTAQLCGLLVAGFGLPLIFNRRRS